MYKTFIFFVDIWYGRTKCKDFLNKMADILWRRTSDNFVALRNIQVFENMPLYSSNRLIDRLIKIIK